MPPSLSDVKTYLGITGSGDDALISSSIVSATAQAERDTSRVFSYASNTSRKYSTNGEASVKIRDVPLTDATRVVTWNGVTLTEGTSYWLLPDRRNPDISVTLQLRPFVKTDQWYLADPDWFAKNLDHYPFGALPLDLTVAGFEGHPTWTGDVTQEVTFLSAWFYWRAKSGASGVIQLPTGEEIDLGSEPVSSPTFTRNWAARTAVAGVGSG